MWSFGERGAGSRSGGDGGEVKTRRRGSCGAEKLRKKASWVFSELLPSPTPAHYFFSISVRAFVRSSSISFGLRVGSVTAITLSRSFFASSFLPFFL